MIPAHGWGVKGDWAEPFIGRELHQQSVYATDTRLTIETFLDSGINSALLREIEFRGSFPWPVEAVPKIHHGGRDFLEAVAFVARGGNAFSPRAARLLRELALGKHQPAAELSPREKEVLKLIASGSSTKDIARHLSLGIKTVETHRTNLMTKLELHNVADLTRYAARQGIVSLE